MSETFIGENRVMNGGIINLFTYSLTHFYCLKREGVNTEGTNSIEAKILVTCLIVMTEVMPYSFSYWAIYLCLVFYSFIYNSRYLWITIHIHEWSSYLCSFCVFLSWSVHFFIDLSSYSSICMSINFPTCLFTYLYPLF